MIKFSKIPNLNLRERVKSLRGFDLKFHIFNQKLKSTILMVLF